MEETGQLKRALIDATAGAVSGGISRTVTSPLDVIKIRFQVYILHMFCAALTFAVWVHELGRFWRLMQ